MLLAQLRRLTESAQPDTTDQSMLIDGTDRATFSSEDQICVRFVSLLIYRVEILKRALVIGLTINFARRFCAKLLA